MLIAPGLRLGHLHARVTGADAQLTLSGRIGLDTGGTTGINRSVQTKNRSIFEAA